MYYARIWATPLPPYAACILNQWPHRVITKPKEKREISHNEVKEVAHYQTSVEIAWQVEVYLQSRRKKMHFKLFTDWDKVTVPSANFQTSSNRSLPPSLGWDTFWLIFWSSFFAKILKQITKALKWCGKSTDEFLLKYLFPFTLTAAWLNFFPNCSFDVLNWFFNPRCG